jgi:hypothetical protein
MPKAHHFNRSYNFSILTPAAIYLQGCRPDVHDVSTDKLSRPPICKQIITDDDAGWGECSGRLEERYVYSQDQQSDPERSQRLRGYGCADLAGWLILRDLSG